MRKIYLLLFTAILLIPSAVSAQLTPTDTTGDVYNLNDFKFRYQRYKGLIFDYKMSGSSVKNRQIFSSQPNTESKEGTFNLNAQLSGFKFENSQLNQRIERYSVAGIFDHQRIPQGNNNGSNKVDFIQSNTSYNLSNRTYDGNKFFVTNLGGNLSFNIYGPGQERALNQKTALGNVSVGFGRGRIENVSDAVTAMFLLKALKRNGSLSGYTAQQLENLADGIVKARNARYIGDDRFRFIDQITIVDSVARANGVAGDNDVKFFTALYDNFIYTSYFRETGKRHTFTLATQGSFYRFSRKDESDGLTNSALGIGPAYEYVNAYQKSVYFQRKTTVTAQVLGVSNRVKQPELSSATSFSFGTLQPTFGIVHGYVYQPNTRTFIDLSGGVNGTFAFRNQDRGNGRSINVGLNLRSNYFVSRRFSLYLNAVAVRNYTHNSVPFRGGDNISASNRTNLSFDSGLVYAFY